MGDKRKIKMKKLLISLFDHSGNASKPYRDSGEWEVMQIDIKKGMPKRMDEKGNEKPLIWGDLKAFCNTLTEEQLAQSVFVHGNEKGGGAYSVFMSIDEGINPSGEGVEPRRLYSKSEDKEDRITAHEEPTVLEKGTIILNVDF